MSQAKDMTLMLWIRANGKQAAEELNRINKLSGLNNFTGSGIGGQISRGFSMTGSTLGFLLRPLRAVMNLTMGFAGAAALAGGAALKFAADDEELIERLTMLVGSADAAKRAFAEIESISTTRPFDVQQLVEAELVLKNIGMGGRRALISVAEAARMTGQSVQTMALAMVSLEERSLRRMGIEVNKDSSSGAMELRFRDKMGRIKQIVAKDAEEARKALVSIFENKTSGSEMGLKSMGVVLKNILGQAAGDFGKGMLNGSKAVMKQISDWFRGMFGKGTFEEWGKKLGKWLDEAVKSLRAAIDTFPVVIEALKTVFSSGMDNVVNVFKAAAKGFGSVLLVSVVQSLVLMKDIFVGLGKILASAFMEDILQLPGMGGTRGKMFDDIINTSTPKEMYELMKANGISSRDDFFKKSAAEQARIIAGVRRDRGVREGFDQVRSALPEAVAVVGTAVKEAFAGVNSAIKNGSGVDIGGSFKTNRSLYDAIQMGPPVPDVITVRNKIHSGYFKYGRTKGGLIDQSQMEPIYETVDRQFTRLPGHGAEVGGKTRTGGVILNIQSLTVHANDERELQNRIMEAGGSLLTSPAET